MEAGEVTGWRRADREEAGRAVVMRREDLNQLVLELTGLRQSGSGRTFGELADDWIQRISKVRVCADNERRHLKHLAALCHLREGELTKGRIEDVLGRLIAPIGRLGAATVNKLRGTGRLIIQDAQGNSEWRGPNPFELVRRLREPKRLYVTLTLPEVTRLLPKLRADHLRLVRTVLLVGLRSGEALGLMKVDVDLDRKMMRVRRSHGRNQTKTGKEREFPIPDELVEDLRAAMELSKGDYVFPRPDGSRQREDTKLSRMLHRALKEAGIVTGYRYSCRRKGCGHFETRAVLLEEQDCPACNFRFWVSAIPKPLRFYDLRHSAATLHREAGCDPMVIQQMLGHTMNLTDGTYTHLSEEYRREQLNKLKLG